MKKNNKKTKKDKKKKKESKTKREIKKESEQERKSVIQKEGRKANKTGKKLLTDCFRQLPPTFSVQMSVAENSPFSSLTISLVQCL